MARSPSRLRGAPGPQGPIVVGIETGGEHLGLALWRLPQEAGAAPSEWRLLEERTGHRGHRHATLVLGWLDEALQAHDCDVDQIGLIACGRGPGGFTGIRVGMATALGLSLGLGRPVWPVDSLTALALKAAPSATAVVTMIDAKRGEVYGCAFQFGEDGRPTPVFEPMVGAPAAVLEVSRAALPAAVSPLIYGSGAVVHKCASDVPRSWHVPSAADVALIGAMAWERSHRDPEAAPTADPAYVRPSDAELEAAKRARPND